MYRRSGGAESAQAAQERPAGNVPVVLTCQRYCGKILSFIIEK